MAVDDPLGAVLARFGSWQIRTLLLVALVKVPSAWHMASILFTAPSPAPHQYWCARPQALRFWDVEWWRNLSHPPLGTSDQLDPCNIYDVAYEMYADTWPLLPVLNNTGVRPCEQFEYQSPSTVVTQWHLVCEREVLVSVSQFFYLLGILVGGVLCTKLLGRISPRTLLLAGMGVQVLTGIGVAFAQHFELQVFLRFVTAAACAHMFTAGYIICTDITTGRCRLMIGSCYEHFWSLGVITLPYLAGLFDDWRHLQLAISLPTVLVLLAYRWIPESPRWLLNKDRTEDVRNILESVLRFNGQVKSVVDIPAFPVNRTANNCVVPSFHPMSRLRYVALHVAWAATIVTYYGALLNVKNIGDRLFLNTVIAGLAEIVGVLLGLSLILWISRKWLALGTILLVGGAACHFSWVLPLQDEWLWYWVMLGLAMAGRVAIACSLTLLTVTSAEFLPLVQRQQGIFSSVTFARLCLLSAPFIGSLATYGDCVSLSAFAGITMVGGMAMLILAQQDKPQSEAKLQNISNKKNNSSSQPKIPRIIFRETSISLSQSLNEMV